MFSLTTMLVSFAWFALTGSSVQPSASMITKSDVDRIHRLTARPHSTAGRFFMQGIILLSPMVRHHAQRGLRWGRRVCWALLARLSRQNLAASANVKNLSSIPPGRYTCVLEAVSATEHGNRLSFRYRARVSEGEYRGVAFGNMGDNQIRKGRRKRPIHY